jgi:hypothetical protein
MHNEKLARVGGYMNGRISLHAFNLRNKRFTQRADPKDRIKVFTKEYCMPQFFFPLKQRVSLRQELDLLFSS